MLINVWALCRIILGASLILIAYHVAAMESSDFFVRMFCLYFMIKGACMILFNTFLVLFVKSASKQIEDDLNFYDQFYNREIIDI